MQTLPEETEQENTTQEESTSAPETESPAQTDPSEETEMTGTEETPDPEEEKRLMEARLFRWIEGEDGRTYYAHAGSGHPIKGFREIGGKTYYFSEKDGAMATGFTEIGGKTYCFDVNGAMLRNTKVSGYSIDENGVCAMDLSGRFTLTEYNLNAYCDSLLEKNGRTPEAIYNYVWKNFRQKPNEPIGNLLDPTEHEIDQMIIRFFNDGGGACCDYSYATQRLLERAGYRNVIVHCDPRQSRHQWNLVEISPGVWRHMDTFRKAYRLFLLTDDEIAAYDTDDVPYRWDRSRWTSTTSTGTGGVNPVKTPEKEAAETTAAPETTTPAETTPAATTAPETTTPAETTAAPETTTAAETTPAATTVPETTAPETTESPVTEPETETAPAAMTAPDTTVPAETETE